MQATGELMAARTQDPGSMKSFVEDAADTADGFAKLAAYGRVAGAYRWLVDTDNNGVPNLIVTEPAGNGLPVAGNFDRLESNGDANGDEVGLKTGNTWRFDTDHDFTVDATLVSDLAGYPIVGDFDGDGIDDLGFIRIDFFRRYDFTVFDPNILWATLNPIGGIENSAPYDSYQDFTAFIIFDNISQNIVH